MKRILKRSLFSIVVLILSLTLNMQGIKVSAQDANEGNYEIKIEYGIDGKYKSYKYLPITVDVKSKEEDFTGEVEIRVPSSTPGSYDAYSKEVTIKKGESTKVSIPVMLTEGNSKFTVNLTKDNKSIVEKKMSISKGRISEGSLFVGLLTDDVNSLGYLGNVEYVDSNIPNPLTLNTVKLDFNSIGDNYLNIDALDIIFINNFNLGNFKAEHYSGLNAWVNKGGTLVIGAGVNESKTVKILDKSLIDVKSNGVLEKEVKVINDTLKLNLSQLEIADSEIKLASNEDKLAYSVKKGKGEILITTFDLGTEPLISSKDSVEVWNKLLIDKFQKVNEDYKYGGGYYSYERNSLVSNIPVEKIPSIWLLGGILAAFALIIGIVLYLVLKKINKRDYIWLAVPITSVIFAVIIFLTGTVTRVNDVVLNQINILNLNNDGKAQVKGIVGIGSKYKGDLIIEKPEGIVMNFRENMNHYYNNPEDMKIDKLRVKTTYRNNNSYFSFKDSDALNMKNFEVYGNDQTLPKLESSFNLDGGLLNGVVKNNLDSNINKLILVSGDSIWELGSVKKGEEVSLNNIELINVSGFDSYSHELTNRYWQSRWDKSIEEKDEEFKWIERYSNIYRVISEEAIVSSSDTKLIAITDMPIEYGFDFSKKDVSKFDTTVIIQDTVVDFKDKDGNLNYPLGHFKSVIENSVGSIYQDDYAGLINGEGEMTLAFNISEDIDVVSIDVRTLESKYGSSRTAEYLVFNNEINDYEKIDLTNGITLSEPGKYLSNNVMKIKVSLKEAGDGEIPKIAVKGRVK